MSRQEIDVGLNDQYYNCEDRQDDLFPDHLDEKGEDTENNKEVFPYSHLETYVNELNYNYMKHESGLTDVEFEKWKEEIIG